MPGSISSATVYTNCWSSLISHTRILLTSKNFLLHSNWRTRRENRDQRSEVGEKRLAAAQCGMPMAFRLVLLNDFFLRLSLRKRGVRSLPERPSLSALCGGKPQPVPDIRQPIPDFKFQIPDFRVKISDLRMKEPNPSSAPLRLRW